MSKKTWEFSSKLHNSTLPKGEKTSTAHPISDNLGEQLYTQEKHITTLPETNIFAPENRPGPKRKFHIPTIHFQGLTVSFGECNMEIRFLIPNGPPRCCGQSLLRLKIGWKSMGCPSSTSKKNLAMRGKPWSSGVKYSNSTAWIFLIKGSPPTHMFHSDFYLTTSYYKNNHSNCH